MSRAKVGHRCIASAAETVFSFEAREDSIRIVTVPSSLTTTHVRVLPIFKVTDDLWHVANSPVASASLWSATGRNLHAHQSRARALVDWEVHHITRGRLSIRALRHKLLFTLWPFARWRIWLTNYCAALAPGTGARFPRRSVEERALARES